MMRYIVYIVKQLSEENDIMIIRTQSPVILNGMEFDCNQVEITDNSVSVNHGWKTVCKLPLNNVKELSFNGGTIFKDGKFSFECSGKCRSCPMMEIKELDVYISPGTYRRGSIHYCNRRERYSEDIEKLPTSRMKYTSDLRLRKAYGGIKDKFLRKGVKHITQETVKECINDIESCMTPNSEGEAYNEYGHYHIELEQVEIRENKYGYSVYHHGRMGDYGWTSNILIHKRCDKDKLYSALRKRYGNVVSIQ